MTTNKTIHETFKKRTNKLGLFKINEDECWNEEDNSEEESKGMAKLQLKRTDLDKQLKRIDDYSSREKMSSGSSKLWTNIDPLSKAKMPNYNAPRGRDLFFSYNTQYGGGFGNFKNTKLSQYNQAYTKIEDKKKVWKKKQTASSLQRIEQNHQFGKMSSYNKISSNLSKNEFSTSVYDIDTTDPWLGKKKTSAMEVMEFAKMFKNKVRKYKI